MLKAKIFKIAFLVKDFFVILIFSWPTKYMIKGSDCGAVGRAVAYDTRDQQFKSSYKQFNFLTTVLR